MCRMLRVLLIGCATLMLLGTTLALAGSTRDDTLGLRVREDTQEASSVLERGVQSLGGCLVYPANNVWNTPVDTLPVHTHSADFINAIGAADTAHADFGSGTWDGGPIGIPFAVVPATQTLVAINYVEYGDESDPGPFPIPSDAPVEWGNDHHVLIVRQGECKLYELYHAAKVGNGWNAGSGAVFTLTANGPFRPDGWTSADYAGLPLLHGLARYDEVAAGEINHALRFTAFDTGGHVWPALHPVNGDPTPELPAMGQRFRLKASFAIDNRFSTQTAVILRALKRYGLILADHGSPWYVSGAPDERWDNDQLAELANLQGSDFEAVDASSLMIRADSGQVWKTWTTHIFVPLVFKAS